MNSDEELRFRINTKQYSDGPHQQRQGVRAPEANIYLDEYDAVVTVLANFSYFKCKTTEDAECIERYNVLRKMMVMTGSAYINYSRFLKTDDGKPTEEYVTNEEIVVTVLAYFNFFLCLTRVDVETIVCYYGLRKLNEQATRVLIHGTGKRS